MSEELDRKVYWLMKYHKRRTERWCQAMFASLLVAAVCFQWGELWRQCVSALGFAVFCLASMFVHCNAWTTCETKTNATMDELRKRFEEAKQEA